jgi:hypothetical protein
MKTIFLFAGLVFLLSSCERDQPGPKPEIKPQPVYYSCFTYGDYQFTEAGLYLPDSIGIQIREYPSYRAMNGIQVKFRVLSGGGSVDNDKVIADEEGRAFTHWKLGTASHRQILDVTFTDAKDSVLSSARYTAYGYRTGAWDTIYYYTGLPNLESIVVDTLRNQSYGIISDYPFTGGLYIHGTRFFDWNFTGTQCDDWTLLSLDRDGNIFMYGTNRGVTVSKDQGITWAPVNLPESIQSPDQIESIRLFTQNGILWIYSTARTLYRSTDMGTSWSADTAGFGRAPQLTHLTAHPGGTVFALIDGIIHKSVDNGLTWKKLKQMALYVQMAGNNLIAIDPEGNFYKSSDFGESFTKIINHYPNCRLKYPGSMIASYKGTWYVAVSGYGLKSTRDFITFEDLYYFPKIYQVRIDNVGTIRVVDNRVELFYKSSEF